MMAKTKKILKHSAIGFTVILMALFLEYMIVRDNIHTVKVGELYRSAQLSPSRLERFIQQNHIRTVINLRGANPRFPWYQDELSVSHTMGVHHYDLKLSSTQLPTPAQLQRLIYLFKTAPKPILIHCQGGADRTGFAASMWMLMHGRSLAEASHAFSILYFVHRSDSIGKQVMPYYIHWLHQHHYRQSSPARFMQWVSLTTLSNTQ